MRVDRQGEWKPMERVSAQDPAFVAEKVREESLEDRTWTDLPRARATPHMWRGMMPAGLVSGTHRIEVKATHADGGENIGHRLIRVE